MNLVEEMYQLAVEKEGITKKGLEVDRAVIKMTQKADTKKLAEDEKYLSILLWDATTLGQEEGFVLGFQYGIRLMTNCFE